MAEQHVMPVVGQVSACTTRLQKELSSLMTSTLDEGISAFPSGDNILKWIATITGPAGTFYDDQKYHLAIEFSTQYPYVPPIVHFTTPCFHPNVEPTNGAICLDVLKEKWSALMDVRSILLSIQSLLSDPNINDPLNIHAARLWHKPAEYQQHLEKFNKDPKMCQTQIQTEN